MTNVAAGNNKYSRSHTKNERRGEEFAETSPAPFVASNQFGSEEEPEAELNVTRLVEIGVTSRDTEGQEII